MENELKQDKVFSHYDDVIKQYPQNYAEIFEILYPALGSNGFTERNQSVNFASTYKTIAKTNGEYCVTWFELPFDKNNHYDAVIINSTTKEILVIEAKRINKNTDGIRGDIKRIMRFPEVLAADGGARLSRSEDYKIYGVVLADVWDGSARENIKNKTKESFRECNFLSDEFEKDTTVRYEILSFSEYNNIESASIRNNYFLLTMVWSVK